jgi:hypothetical protein
VLVESLFDDPRANRLFSLLRPGGLVSVIKGSGSSVNGSVVNVGGDSSDFWCVPFRHPRCGDFDRVRPVFSLIESSLASSSSDKTFARGNFGGGPLSSIWSGAFEDATHLVLERSSRATGKTGSKGW